MRRFTWLFIGVFSLSLGVAVGQPQAQVPLIGYAEIDGTINPISKDFLIRVIDQATRDNASLLIVRLDTPGGLLESTKDIVEAIFQSPIPVVIWVGPVGARAASAGAFITMAADVAVMASVTHIGASTPVSLGGEAPESKEDPARKKILNDAAAMARSIAEKRHRSVEWAEKFVLEGASLTAQEALNNKVIDSIADDLEGVIASLNNYEVTRGEQKIQLQTSGAAVKRYELSLKEQLMGYLADPNIVYILLMVGIYALIAEFFTPGFGVGIGGAICLLLALFGLQVMPLNLTGLALIALGVALMIIDLFATTHLALTVGGVVSILLGSFMLFNPDDLLAPAFQISPVNIFVTVGTITGIFVFIVTKGLLIQRRPVTTGKEGMVGAVGTARDELNPTGTVFVKGEYWTAIATDGPIKPGQEVFVERIQNGKLIVRQRKEV